jgi:hypothetical protein
MLTVNPDTYPTGKFSPFHYVTAIFDTPDDLDAIVESLEQNGFSGNEIDVFLGEEGAEKLDVHGKRVGLIKRWLRGVKEFFTDETEIHAFLDQKLRAGGMSILVNTIGRDERRAAAVQVLKTFGPSDVRYWGNAVIEQF